MAQDWAGRCLELVHGNPPKPDSINYDNIGQNIYWTTREMDYTTAIENWYSEVDEYDYDSLQCDDICSHYTQVCLLLSNMKVTFILTYHCSYA